LRLNEPLPLGFHNTISFGYVRNVLSSQFSLGSPAPKAEHGFEFNVLLLVGPFLVQPVAQHYENVGSGTQRASVFGLRTKVEF
jgi:porin